MNRTIATWLRRLARWCERLADDIDSHQHEWFFHVGTYGRQTCTRCRYTELWRPAKAPPAPGDTGVAHFRGFVDTEWEEFGHQYGH